ncbi:MAG: hypothetical protein EOP88_00445 [Verrucomicrobiaceae bacterium]|nr:MAG: hypothetical protein EOP88_00445 [Verrucomicrobiaceae bacterium]
MNLVSGESLRDVMEVGGVAEPLELRSFGQMVFRAVRPNICRMTLSLDFAVGSGDDLENAIEDHVARLERRVDRFAEWFEGSSESREHDELPVFA